MLKSAATVRVVHVLCLGWCALSSYCGALLLIFRGCLEEVRRHALDLAAGELVDELPQALAHARVGGHLGPGELALLGSSVCSVAEYQE